MFILKIYGNFSFAHTFLCSIHQIWQCGGEVLIATCSRVGHVFRKISPYSWPGGVATILNHNTQRIADVWMDEYKDFFYKTNPGTHITMVICICTFDLQVCG